MLATAEQGWRVENRRGHSVSVFAPQENCCRAPVAPQPVVASRYTVVDRDVVTITDPYCAGFLHHF